jgi:hypothetical protein
MFKKLSPKALELHAAGYKYQDWFGIVEPDLSIEDIYNPQFWAHYKGKFGKYDRIRLRARDGSFDMEVTVISVADNGDFAIENWPKYRGGDDLTHREAARRARAAAEAVRPRTVPLDANGDPRVKIEFIEAAGWRLRGIDGLEVSREHPNETAARAAMEEYLAFMKVEMPSDEAIAARKAEIAAEREAQAAGDDGPRGRGKKKAA